MAGGICINQVNDELRRRQRAARLAVAVAAEPADLVADDVANADTRAVVHGLVDRLSADHRTVIALRFGEDRSIADVAKRLGRSPDAVKQLQRRVLDELLLCLPRETMMSDEPFTEELLDGLPRPRLHRRPGVGAGGRSSDTGAYRRGERPTGRGAGRHPLPQCRRVRPPDSVLGALLGCDLILHCGDIDSLGVLDRLSTVAPVIAVRSKIDPVADGVRLHESPLLIRAGSTLIGMSTDFPTSQIPLHSSAPTSTSP